MKALTFTAPRSARIIDRDEPEQVDDLAILAPYYVGLCGTDYELYDGSMPYFDQGRARYPIQPGHEVAGIVVESNDPRVPPGSRAMVDPVVGCGRCAACEAGRQTHCQDRLEVGIRGGMPGGASELVAVPVRNLHLVPPNVSLRDAVLVEPGVTAFHAVIRFDEVAERKALVIGAGTLGLISAQLLRARGAQVDVLVIAPSRRPLIEDIGAVPALTVRESNYDLVVEAAGTASAIHAALAAVAPGGEVALIGVQAAPVDNVDVNLAVLKDATLFGVLNGPGLYDQLLDEIAARAFNPEVLVESEFHLTEAEHALACLEERDRARPKILLRIAT